MISVKQAKQLVLENTTATEVVSVPLLQACGCVLAEDIYATIDIPPFDQSAMDGYAFKLDDWNKEIALRINGEIPAGGYSDNGPGKSEAVRIFTGAPVPEGADTVVMQEKTSLHNSHILIEDDQLKKGSNVRPKGSQTKKGDKAIDAGTKLGAAAIGYLAGLGIAEVKTYKRPSVFLIITGRELQQPGKELKPGQVYECNSFSIAAALQQLHIDTITITTADDDESIITELIKKGIASSDLVILTGGVSAGDYDFVCKASVAAGVATIFHKVKQKPGKPLYFGRTENSLIFGLPGNPASVLTCFYEYVVPCIEKMMGIQRGFITITQMPLADTCQKKEGLTHFLKARISGMEIRPLPAQESYQMGSFAMADGFILLEEERAKYEKGELVEVHLFQQ